MRLPVLSLLLPLLAAPAHATTWLGGTGVWTDPANWDAGVPTTTSDVLIDDGNATASDVTLDATTEIQSLVLDAGDQLRVQGPAQVNLRFGGAGAALHNDGLILLGPSASSSSQTFLDLRADLALSGTGTIRLDRAQITGFATPTPVLTNGAGHTIEGAGSVGNSSFVALVNEGLIHANVAGSSLVVSSAGGVLTNTGTIRASNGGGISVFTPDHVGAGAYEATGAGSRVTFFSGSTGVIQDAVFEGSAGGVVQGSDAFNLSRKVTLERVENRGYFQGADVALRDSFRNSGLVEILNSRTLSLESAVGIDGGGTIDLQGGHVAGPFALDLVDNTLAGFGDVDVAATIRSAAAIAPGTAADPTRRFTFADTATFDGRYAIDLGGTAADSHDQLDVLATAVLGASILLDVELVPGYAPLDGDFFDVLIADAITQVGGLAFDFPALPGTSFSHALVDLGGREALRITAHVPEPALGMLLLGALAAVCGARRRRG